MVGLGQQVELRVTVAAVQHGEVEPADKLACGQRLQLLLEADRQHLPDHDWNLVCGRGEA
jgi:hypothetical protein